MRKFAFRFFFLLFLLTISPWYFLYDIPGISFLLDFVQQGEVWMVNLFNQHLFKVKDVLNQNGNGSGDTSYAWAQFYTFMVLALLGSLLWSIVRRNKAIKPLDFWLRNLVRYNLALVSLGYGIIKLFALQMPFPTLSQLATPLGDFLPMRLSWMFIGYSAPYQMFSGVMEIVVAILLLNRKTITLGALTGVAVFANVFMLNLSYDIPVKLYSMQLLIYSLFLSVQDWKRLVNFFLLNKSAAGTDLYHIELTKKWQKIVRVVCKLAFILLFVIWPFYSEWGRYQEEAAKGELKPIKVGLYNIKSFVKNNDTLAVSNNDLAWKDFIFDKGGMGSINTTDSLFRQRYRRGYFVYQPDTLTQTIQFKKNATDSTSLFTWKYKIIDDRNLELWGTLNADSIHFVLERSNRHFQLTEKQFHWISEANR